MTNEELAIQIQLGKSEYYAELWERVRLLMYKLLRSRISGVELPNYIAKEDMEQELYFAFCKAVEAYDNTKPYKFTSYLNFHIRNTVRDALSVCKFKESSYNQTTGDEYNTELIDLMPDAEAEEKLNIIELIDLQKTVREAVSSLPYNERQVITLYYFRNLTFRQISQLVGTDENIIKKYKEKGLCLLRRNKTIKRLYNEFECHYRGFDDIGWKWDYSKEKKQVVNFIAKKREQGQFISYGKEQTILFTAKIRYLENISDISHRINKR